MTRSPPHHRPTAILKRNSAIYTQTTMKLQAVVDGTVPAGAMAAHLDWARFGPGGRNINVLTSEKLADMGNAATFYSVCVEVELFRA